MLSIGTEYNILVFYPILDTHKYIILCLYNIQHDMFSSINQNKIIQ